jgi:hypothetical protein
MNRRVHEVQKPTQEQIRASSEVLQYASETSTAAKSLETTKVSTIAAKSATTQKTTPTLSYYPPHNGNDYQKGVCSEVLASGLGPFVENCDPPLDCCSQYTCPYGLQRKTIASVVEYVNSETPQNIEKTEQNFCFAPWNETPSSNRGDGRKRRSMGLFEYWAHGGGLGPVSMNMELEDLRNVEDARIQKLAEKMVTTGQLDSAINGQESEISLLKDSYCIANTNTVNNLKLSELRIGYSNLATKIENSIRTCSQNEIPTAVHYRLIAEACKHINPSKTEACAHPEVISAFGCQVKSVAIGEDRIELALSLSIPVFVKKMQLSHIFAFPYLGRNHDVRVLNDLP